MNRYEFPMPRAALGFAALAMSALTIGVLVVLPSRMESDSQAYALFAASRAAQCAAAVPAKCTEVVGMDDAIGHEISTVGQEVSFHVAEPHCDERG
jgi:hypothetical protein